MAQIFAVSDILHVASTVSKYHTAVIKEFLDLVDPNDNTYSYTDDHLQRALVDLSNGIAAPITAARRRLHEQANALYTNFRDMLSNNFSAQQELLSTWFEALQTEQNLSFTNIDLGEALVKSFLAAGKRVKRPTLTPPTPTATLLSAPNFTVYVPSMDPRAWYNSGACTLESAYFNVYAIWEDTGWSVVRGNAIPSWHPLWVGEPFNVTVLDVDETASSDLIQNNTFDEWQNDSAPDNWTVTSAPSTAVSRVVAFDSTTNAVRLSSSTSGAQAVLRQSLPFSQNQYKLYVLIVSYLSQTNDHRVVITTDGSNSATPLQAPNGDTLSWTLPVPSPFTNEYRVFATCFFAPPVDADIAFTLHSNGGTLTLNYVYLKEVSVDDFPLFVINSASHAKPLGATVAVTYQMAKCLNAFLARFKEVIPGFSPLPSSEASGGNVENWDDFLTGVDLTKKLVCVLSTS